MNGQNVFLKIRTVQNIPGDEPQTMELHTTGTLTRAEDCTEISYEETQITGLAGVQTTFLIYGKDRVVLRRSGAELKSNMDFRLGKRDDSLYDVGFGALMISVTATRMEIEPEQGFFEFEYDVEVERTVMGTNLCRVEFRENK
ncbi:MAG: DUF1934 domain-containing protein [Oscillospiraceae bacterium]|nr:DUF1934 domain-containing protein [Oscillospiraceae bacterium]